MVQKVGLEVCMCVTNYLSRNFITNLSGANNVMWACQT